MHEKINARFVTEPTIKHLKYETYSSFTIIDTNKIFGLELLPKSFEQKQKILCLFQEMLDYYGEKTEQFGYQAAVKGIYANDYKDKKNYLIGIMMPINFFILILEECIRNDNDSYINLNLDNVEKTIQNLLNDSKRINKQKTII